MTNASNARLPLSQNHRHSQSCYSDSISGFIVVSRYEVADASSCGPDLVKARRSSASSDRSAAREVGPLRRLVLSTTFPDQTPERAEAIKIMRV